MKILVSGGGTGGHVTPILAVAHELKILKPDAQIIYVAEKGAKFADLASGHDSIDQIHTIFAGKFRRFHGESFFTKLLDFKTNFKNLRDIFFVTIGLFQAYFLLKKIKPDVIFLKGGFVVVPVGLAASMLKIPFVTHDSDNMPGLANRIVGKWAKIHATGMPEEFYNYPKEKTRYVGVIVGKDFVRVNSEIQHKYKKELGIPEDSKLLLVTGGSLGAQRLNQTFAKVAKSLLEKHLGLYIVHQVGRGNLETYKDYDGTPERLQILEFMEKLYLYMGAAEVVITRAGATNLAELGIQGKACIVVPNPQLAGGHQIENARYLSEHNAAIVLDETELMLEPNHLQNAIERLLEDKTKRQELGLAMNALSKPDAANALAKIIIEIHK